LNPRLSALSSIHDNFSELVKVSIRPFGEDPDVSGSQIIFREQTVQEDEVNPLQMVSKPPIETEKALDLNGFKHSFYISKEP
jgi:hypothetical protein